MKFGRFAVLAAFIIATFLFTAYLPAQSDGPKALEGKPAPDISLTTLDGKSVKLSEQKGSVVVMDFWATWCGPCKLSLPHIQKISEDKSLAEKGLKVWAVNARETKDKIEPFMSENKYTFAVPMDAAGAAMKEYMIRGIPTTIVVGRDGVIRNVFVGFGEGSDQKLDKAIEEALK